MDSGVRVVTEEVPSVRSVALGLWVRTGSRNEAAAQAGVSHFLEHLLFKGTARYSAVEISERFDGLGASVNAATGKETTYLHARFLDEHTEEVFDLLAEMLLAPTYPEIDSEREVVLEEIAMYEDEPQDRVHDILAEAVFAEHPLGRRVLGEAEVISSIPVPEIEAYRRRRYTGAHVVVGAAGHLRHEAVVALAERLVSPPSGGDGASAIADPGEAARLRFYPKDTEQYHICFGAPGIVRDDERRFALAVLDSIFGDSASSRLFREVREKRGLAYSVYSYNTQYADAGLFAVYAGCAPGKVDEVLALTRAELARVARDGLTEAEVARGRGMVKGGLVLGLEDTGSRMSRLGKSELLYPKLLSVDELLALVDAVTVDQVRALAAEVLARPMSLAVIGPFDEGRFGE